MGRIVLENVVGGFILAALGALGWMLLAQAPTWGVAGWAFTVFFVALAVVGTARDLLLHRIGRQGRDDLRG